MRKHVTLRPSLCVLLALPALALRGDEQADRDAQRERLVHTVGSLATYRDIQRQLEERQPSATLELLRITEPPPADPARAEVEIEELRARVQSLQEILDARAAMVGRPADQGVVPTSMPVREPRPPANTDPAATQERAGGAPDVVPAPAPTTEEKEFIADRKRLGRACWRGGRFEEGVAALEPLAGDPQADYWRARCLEKLARSKEAIALYRAVIETAADTPEGRSAREDCEFLEWSIAHGLVEQP